MAINDWGSSANEGFHSPTQNKTVYISPRFLSLSIIFPHRSCLNELDFIPNLIKSEKLNACSDAHRGKYRILKLIFSS